MDAERDRAAAWLAGAWAGVAGLAAFLIVHHVLIRPIWFVAPLGLLVAALAGVAVGNAYAELQPHLPRRPWTAPAVGGLVAIILLPAFLLAEAHGQMFTMNATGEAVLLVPALDVVRMFTVDLLLSAGVTGAVAGWVIAKTRRGAAATGLAGVAFALGPGHNIPFLGGTSGVGTELLLVAAMLAAAALVLVEVHAWRVRRS